MAVKPENRSGYRSLLQRGIDTASEYADTVADKVRRVADPRARLLRKRRWALRLGLFSLVTCVFWALVTALLASWSTPAWALIIPGAFAAGGAAPGTRRRARPPRRTRGGRGGAGHAMAVAILPATSGATARAAAGRGTPVAAVRVGWPRGRGGAGRGREG